MTPVFEPRVSEYLSLAALVTVSRGGYAELYEDSAVFVLRADDAMCPLPVLLEVMRPAVGALQRHTAQGGRVFLTGAVRQALPEGIFG